MSNGRRRPAPVSLDRLFRTALFFIPIGVLGNLAFSLLTTDRATLGSLQEFPRGYLVLAVALGLAPWLTNTLRLLIWTHVYGHRISFRDAFGITLGTDLGAAISPTAVGGGVLKWGMLVQRGVRPGASASLTVLPQIEDGLFFLIALPIAIWISESWNLPIFRQIASEMRGNVVIVVLIMTAIALGTQMVMRLVLTGGMGERLKRQSLWRFGRSRRLFRRTRADAKEAFQIVLKRGKKWFATSMGLTAIQWTCRYSVISALAAFLGADVDPVLFWVLQWVVFTLMMFIPTPGAAGGAEAAFFFIYSAFLPERILGLATAGWRFLTFYLQLGLAAILFAILHLGSSHSTARPSPDGDEDEDSRRADMPWDAG